MSQRRSIAAIAAAVLCIVYGTLVTAFTALRLVSLATMDRGPRQAGGEREPLNAMIERQMNEYIAERLPLQPIIEIVSPFLGLLVAVLLLVSGIGILLMVKKWRGVAMSMSIFGVVLGLLIVLYQFGFLIPTIKDAIRSNPRLFKLPANVTQSMHETLARRAVIHGIISGGQIVSLLVIVFLLSQRSVKTAFAASDGDGVGRGTRRVHDEGEDSGEGPIQEKDDDWERPPSRGGEPDEGHFRTER